MPPFDSRLVLGHLVHPEDIANLQKLAEIEYPEILADQKLQKLMLSERKLQGIYEQMKHMIDAEDKTSLAKLTPMKAKLELMTTKISTAAEDLIEKTLTCLDAKKKLATDTPQKTISMSIESPVDFSLSAVANFALASDSMQFDVQYLKDESNDQGTETGFGNQKRGGANNDKSGQTKSDGDDDKKKDVKVKTTAGQTPTTEDSDLSSLTDKVSDFVRNWMKNSTNIHSDLMKQSQGGNVLSIPETRNTSQLANTNTANDVKDAMSSQTQRHDIQGTLVIVANCSHKMADVMSPCILDPVKLLSAWNNTFPKDKLLTDSHSMFTAVEEKKAERTSPNNALHILSGCTRASSFIGMANVLNIERTVNSQSGSNVAEKITSIVNKQLVKGQKTGQTNQAMDNARDQIANLMGSADIFSHCSLVTQGIIPNINASTISTTVSTLEPTAGDAMQSLNAIKTAGQTSVDDTTAANTSDAQVAQSKKGAQFLEMKNKFATDMVQNIAKMDAVKSKVLDTNSLMNAFSDYLTKAQAGKCGIPVNFYIKTIDKGDVARAYICCYYPNGVTDGMSAEMGAIGKKPK